MINWKVRFKNPVFVIQLLFVFFTPAFVYFGVTGQQITTWGIFFEVLIDAFSNPYVLFSMVAALWNAITDPTTRGTTDSRQALEYDKPK